MDVIEAKGLEFDAVVVVDPDGIAAEGEGGARRVRSAPGSGRIVALTSDHTAGNLAYGSSKGAMDRIVLAATKAESLPLVEGNPTFASVTDDVCRIAEVELPKTNKFWILFFLFCGAANLYVAFTYQDFWVDFKVFGSLGMTLVFLVGQGIYLTRHMHDPAPSSTTKTED